jgi:hypothetical protein
MDDVIPAIVPAVFTGALTVVFTTTEETLEALRVGWALACAMTIPVTLLLFRTDWDPSCLNDNEPASPYEIEECVRRARAEGIDVRVRLYLYRALDPVIPLAFKRHSLIVIGGRRSWWPTATERLRRRLEAAGHFVLLVDPSEQSACGNGEALKGSPAQGAAK